jgi:hypothetical protein
LDVALHQVGPVLTKVPADASGLWINEVVASELNRPDMEELRSGYCSGLFNQRDAHWVDPTGAPEEELGMKYEAWANAANQRGYPRLAGAMRRLAKEYQFDAQRIRDTHGYDDL